MAKTKKKQALTLEERLEQALVPEGEQPYALPENWVWTRLELLTKDMADGPFGSNLKREHYTNEKQVRIIQLSNIGETGWKEDNTKYTTFEHAKTIFRSIVNQGNIVIAKMMPAGRAIIVPNNEKGYILSSDAIKVVPQNFINTTFFVNGINSNFFRNQVSGNTQGITRARTSISKLKSYAFPLPPLAEQQRIVERIESLFEKLNRARELMQSVLDSFETRKAAILHKAFTGELTAKWREENGVGIDSWETVNLENVCEKITCGGTPSDKIVEDGEIPFLKVYNIVDNSVNFEYKSQFIDNNTHKTKLKKSMLKPGDVIMNIVGPPLRKIAIIPDNYSEWNMNQAIVRFRPTGRLDRYFLYYCLCYPATLDSVISDTKGVVGQANISITQSRNLEIPLPSLPEQQEVVRILDDLLGKEQAAKNKLEPILDQIDLMKKSILARAFRGELGTNDPSEESSIELLKEVL